MADDNRQRNVLVNNGYGDVPEEKDCQQSKGNSIISYENRIAFLEKELIETKMQLAHAKGSEQLLRLELSKLSSTLNQFTTNSRKDLAKRSICSIPPKSILKSRSHSQNELNSQNRAPVSEVIPCFQPLPRLGINGRASSMSTISTISTIGNISFSERKPSCASGIALLNSCAFISSNSLKKCNGEFSNRYLSASLSSFHSNDKDTHKRNADWVDGAIVTPKEHNQLLQCLAPL